MTSRWEGVPLDILYQQVDYLETPKQIKDFCGDPYIHEKLCKDPNGEIWQYLYKRDLSNKIQVYPKFHPYETIQQVYLRDKEKYGKMKDDINKFKAANSDGYEKILENMKLDISKIAPSAIEQFLWSDILRSKETTYAYILEKVLTLLPDLYNNENLNSDFKFANNQNNLGIMMYLLENYNNDIFDINQALVSASGRNATDTVKYLLEKGADVHYNNDEPLRKALELAIRYANEGGLNVPIIDVLLENGADFNIILDEIEKNPRLKRFLEKYTSTFKKLASEYTYKSEDLTRCTGMTKLGRQCCRKISDGSQYCFQHQ